MSKETQATLTLPESHESFSWNNSKLKVTNRSGKYQNPTKHSLQLQLTNLQLKKLHS